MIYYNCPKGQGERSMKKIRLQALIRDNETGKLEFVVLRQYEGGDGMKVYVEQTIRHGEQMFKILADEGYCSTEYFYPVKRFTIVDLCIYE